MTLDIVNLRDAGEFFPAVADRIWRAWWKSGGTALAELEERLSDVVAATDFPFTLVANADGRFAGTVTAIASDLEERPDLTPWIAALWVEPDDRGGGLARALVERAVQALFDQRHAQVYLYANAPMRSFYLGLGWTLLEEQVGQHGVDIFVRYAPGRHPA
ncbi:MAG: N-acetyltransferase [Devosia sp.]|uniref:GNAT family N-acetyltransferase n=1 Tax=Devosia sp. TaxID=1871048 RepID=UPI002629B560|nr:GNAT family N-acetyltransferase [Devosia sp.]MDB5585100.1 N-acetyltransferase [Devosia sp.]